MCRLHFDFLMHWSVSCMTRGGGGRVHRWVEPVPAAFGQHTLVKSSAPHRADIQGQTTIHTRIPTKADLKWPVCTSPECLSLDCGRNPEDLERTPTDTARACKLQPTSLLLWRNSPNHCITVLRICKTLLLLVCLTNFRLWRVIIYSRQ